MKKIGGLTKIALFLFPLIASVASCVPKEPKFEDFNKQSVPINFGSYLNASIINYDNDTLADAIIDSNNDAIYYDENFKEKVHLTKRSLKMTQNMRDAGFKFIKYHNIIRYEGAGIEYERDIKNYDTTGVKK